MKKFKIVFLLLIALVVNYTFISCDKEDHSYKKSSSSTTNSEKNKITKPTVSILSRRASPTYDGWWVIGKVTTGGDEIENISCYIEYSTFSSKQSGKITSYKKRDKMRYQTGSKSSVTFKIEHAGISRGTYIYFRLVGCNSKYETIGSGEYMVATDY